MSDRNLGEEKEKSQYLEKTKQQQQKEKKKTANQAVGIQQELALSILSGSKTVHLTFLGKYRQQIPWQQLSKTKHKNHWWD